MTHRRVVITGMGAVSALGQGLDATWSALDQGRGGITRIDRRVGDSEIHTYSGPAAVCVPLDTKALETRTGPRPLAHLDPFAAFAVIAGMIGTVVYEHRRLRRELSRFEDHDA